jgi:hypothetical protein
MQSNFDKFYNLYNGKSIEFSDITNKFQCMDGAGKWCEFLGIPYEAIRHLYAYQVWTQPTDLTRKYFDLIPNGPTNVAQIGDLVIFGTKVGYAGHISVGTNKSNSINYVGFEQNWNGRQYMTTVTHYNYFGVLGWLRPKTSVGIPQTYQQKVHDIVYSSIQDTQKVLAIQAITPK